MKNSNDAALIALGKRWATAKDKYEAAIERTTCTPESEAETRKACNGVDRLMLSIRDIVAETEAGVGVKLAVVAAEFDGANPSYSPGQAGLVASVA